MAKPPPESQANFLNTTIRSSVSSIFIFGGTLAMATYLLGGIALPKTAWRNDIAGVHIQYVLSEPNETFNGRKRALNPFGDTCYIEIAINPSMLDRLGAQNYFTYITAHELGHCLDQFRLKGNHGHLKATGDNLNIYGSGETGQAETYADAYAVRYIRTCGTLLRPLGWPVKDGYCIPPDPTTVDIGDSQTDPIALIMKDNDITKAITHDMLDPRGIKQ